MKANPTAAAEPRHALAIPRIIVHFLVLGMLADFLGLSLYEAWPNWGFRQLLLVVLTAIQAGLYLKRWFFTPMEVAPEWWNIYFAGSLACCFPESLISHVCFWMTAPYLGQMCAILAPRISIPASILTFVTIEFTSYGPSRLADRSFGDWVFHVSLFASWMVMGLFIKQIATVSQGRAALICDLAAAKRELQQARERELEFATLRERERLARDLHDNLGHALVTLTVQLEAVQRLLPVDAARAAQLLEEMKSLSRSSTEALRRSLANLRAPGLSDHPLTQTLQSLCAEIGRRTSLKIDCQISPGADGLPPAVAEALWRVAQEGLTNVEKHAQATAATLSVDLQPQQVILLVRDDGIGAPSAAEREPGHYGLRGLRERMEGVGGTFLLTTAQPKGTILEARVPLIA